ncbi:hypothetical protein LCGC14_3046930 [marine sediment metagenome]|uniref:Ice-binding protein C-terminal domain-containing protein n=1 Tax=marine sediment metagenome TaxID=412755 RepID=A0A0F8XB36_9ZZZZ
MKATTSVSVTCVVLLSIASWVGAYPVDPVYDNGPQDPLFLPPGDWHELGDGFPTDEWIETTWDTTNQTACFDGSDDTQIPNVVVYMTNRTSTAWTDLHYVADPETTITNFDGTIGNATLSDNEEAFRIDWVGINRPLIFESMTVDTIFEPGETWQFIIQDFGNSITAAAVAPTPFSSLGIASLSSGDTLSSGSIIALPVPEPATMAFLAMGGLGVLIRRKPTRRGRF